MLTSPCPGLKGKILNSSALLENTFNLQGLGAFIRQKRDQLVFRLRDIKASEIYIWGAGKNGEICLILLKDTEFSVKGVINSSPSSDSFHSFPVFGDNTKLPEGATILIAFNGPAKAVEDIKQRCIAKGHSYLHITDFANTDEFTSATYPNSLNKFHNIHKGKRCFVAGNGPSLNKVDVSKLYNEIVLGSNRCYLGYEKWGFEFPYWGAVDQDVAGWQADEWHRVGKAQMFLPDHLIHLAEAPSEQIYRINICNIDYTDSSPPFSIFPEIIFGGDSVTYTLMQIAAVMGCSPIYLIGVDFHFTRRGTVNSKKKGFWEQTGEDINHFHSDYIPKGKYLYGPDLEKQRLAYISAKNAADLYGFEIYNVSPGSHLDVFEFTEFDNLF